MKKAPKLPQLNIDAAISDPKLFGAALGDLTTWKTWLAVLKGAFGLELDRDEARTFGTVAGGRKSPEQRVRELWCIIGRRSGKSRMAALVAAYLAILADRKKLSPGETGYVLVLARDRDQAKNVFNYVKAFLEESPILRQRSRTPLRMRSGYAATSPSPFTRTATELCAAKPC